MPLHDNGAPYGAPAATHCRNHLSAAIATRWHNSRTLAILLTATPENILITPETRRQFRREMAALDSALTIEANAVMALGAVL
ncbi:hypothetical protein AA12717_1376 [Gluconacetobacter sacchari DSM 12717]|uniref:Uncharacterized protein n=3 Tax=Gluconacetobacter sacchari TaxID=92759 RepID=A0A7W4IBH8_9PROT|nr:hypothetical protein [Gluconacetobacter sacchari]MBB2159697.1 hypothetical protein [Gluconacetobacter sacchari]GBQ23057.1 hypothetical protein AA12717_1376 [Gluconacetobacter sacchari DSM 12717]